MKESFAFVHLSGGDIKTIMKQMNKIEFMEKKLTVEIAKNKAKNDDDHREPRRTLFVVNFPDTCRERDLSQVFSNYGDLLRITIQRNYAFVEYYDVKDAETAQRKLDGCKFMGSLLKVRFASQKRTGSKVADRRSPPPKRRPRFENFNYNGGRRASTRNNSERKRSGRGERNTRNNDARAHRDRKRGGVAATSPRTSRNRRDSDRRDGRARSRKSTRERRRSRDR